jgi:hypothetical protein
MKNWLIRLAFIIPMIWWAYLFFTTQIVVVFDAIGYENLGQLIAHQGWAEFLRQGPQREPMFPWLVSLSMQMGDWWKIEYFYPLKLIGILFLFLTMIFVYRLLKMLAVRPSVAALVILYIGISPVMTNSSMRLWSEFAAYPWVVLAVIWTIKSWKLLENLSGEGQNYARVIGHAFMVALMFILIMSVKAVAEGVLILYLWPFYLRIIAHWRSGRFVQARQVAKFCLVVLIVFEGVVCAYRACNYYANGHFAFTNRGDWAFYGNTVRRMEPLTPRRLGAAIAFVPGMGICPAIYGTDDCDFWSARYSDDLIAQKQNELAAQGITGNAASKYFTDTSIKMILSNPLQEILLMIVEAHKMFIWESSIAFVAYPDWIENILYSPWCTNILKLILAALCWSACAFAFGFLCYRSLASHRKSDEQGQVIFWILNFIFWYMAMYSLFFILDRYSFPIVSLFMVLLAFLLDKMVRLCIR